MLPNDRAHAILADFCKQVKPLTVIYKPIEVDVALLITIVSLDSNIVFRVL